MEVYDRIVELADQHHTKPQIAEIISRETGRTYTIKSIVAFTKNHGIKTGNDGRFKPGSEPFTKGKKWDDYMSKEAQERSLSTCFKKGSLPHNTAPVGTTIVHPDTNKAWVKVKEFDSRGSRFCWRERDRIVYESRTGKAIPPGMVVLHLNKDNSDDRFENLVVVRKQEGTIIRALDMPLDENTIRTSLLIAQLRCKSIEIKREMRNKANEGQAIGSE